MTTLICDFQSIVGEKIEGYATLTAGKVRPSYSSPAVVVHEPTKQEVTQGQTTFENVNPGDAVITVEWADQTQSATIRFVVPDSGESIYLADCLSADSLDPEEIELLRWGIRENLSGAREMLETAKNLGLTEINGTVDAYFIEAAEILRKALEAAQLAEQSLDTIDDKVSATEGVVTDVDQAKQQILDLLDEIAALEQQLGITNNDLAGAVDTINTLSPQVSAATQAASDATQQAQNAVNELGTVQSANTAEFNTIKQDLISATQTAQQATDAVAQTNQHLSNEVQRILGEVDAALSVATEATAQAQIANENLETYQYQLGEIQQEQGNILSQQAEIVGHYDQQIAEIEQLSTEIATTLTEFETISGEQTALVTAVTAQVGSLQDLTATQGTAIAAAQQVADNANTKAVASYDALFEGQNKWNEVAAAAIAAQATLQLKQELWNEAQGRVNTNFSRWQSAAQEILDSTGRFQALQTQFNSDQTKWNATQTLVNDSQKGINALNTKTDEAQTTAIQGLETAVRMAFPQLNILTTTNGSNVVLFGAGATHTSTDRPSGVNTTIYGSRSVGGVNGQLPASTVANSTSVIQGLTYRFIWWTKRISGTDTGLSLRIRPNPSSGLSTSVMKRYSLDGGGTWVDGNMIMCSPSTDGTWSRWEALIEFNTGTTTFTPAFATNGPSNQFQIYGLHASAYFPVQESIDNAQNNALDALTLLVGDPIRGREGSLSEQVNVLGWELDYRLRDIGQEVSGLAKDRWYTHYWSTTGGNWHGNDWFEVTANSSGDAVITAKGNWVGVAVVNAVLHNGTTRVEPFQWQWGIDTSRTYTLPSPSGSANNYYVRSLIITYRINPGIAVNQPYSTTDYVPAEDNWRTMWTHIMPATAAVEADFHVGWHAATFGDQYGIRILINGVERAVDGPRSGVGPRLPIGDGYRTMNVTTKGITASAGQTIAFQVQTTGDTENQRKIREARANIRYRY